MSSISPPNDTTYPAIVGQIVVLLREKSGMDQKALSAAVGISQSTWSRVEHGESALTVEQLAKAASALGVSPSEVLRQADTAASELRNEGIEISPERKNPAGTKALAMIGAAVLGYLVAKALTKK